jgi:hypothetical protein
VNSRSSQARAAFVSIAYKWQSFCTLCVSDNKAMLRIQRSSSNRGVVFSLSGRIETEDVPELQRLLSLEAVGQDITFDLQDVTLVDRGPVKFLARCASQSIELQNCPAYVREWIASERNRTS